MKDVLVMICAVLRMRVVFVKSRASLILNHKTRRNWTYFVDLLSATVTKKNPP